MPATLYCDTAHLMSLKPVPHVMARYLLLISGSTRLDGDAAQAFETACNRSISQGERMAACRSLASRLGIRLEPYLDQRVFQYMAPEDLAEAAHAGLDVQLHTHNHTMHNQEPSEVFAEIEANRQALAGILARDPRTFTDFCYPSGVCSPSAARAAEQSGTRSATTTVQGLTWPGMDLHLLPRLLDGEQLSPIEFEAELSGFADILRSGRALVARNLSRLPFYNRAKVGAPSWNHA